MTTTVAQLIDFLKTQPPEAFVKILQAEDSRGYEGGKIVTEVNLDLTNRNHVTINDWRDRRANPEAKWSWERVQQPWFGTVEILLGDNDN